MTGSAKEHENDQIRDLELILFGATLANKSDFRAEGALKALTEAVANDDGERVWSLAEAKWGLERAGGLLVALKKHYEVLLRRRDIRDKIRKLNIVGKVTEVDKYWDEIVKGG